MEEKSEKNEEAIDLENKVKAQIENLDKAQLEMAYDTDDEEGEGEGAGVGGEEVQDAEEAGDNAEGKDLDIL